MDRYKDRSVKRILKGVKIVYLATAVGLVVGAGCFGFQRNQLKDKWQAGKISHEEYIKECRSYGEKEEGVFKTFALVGGGALATEVVVRLKTKDRER